jgi:hemoglobin/transferrin/lactoferrin receptor protein
VCSSDLRFSTSRRTITPPGLSFPIAPFHYQYQAKQSALGAFVQDEWTLGGDFTATLGLRETWVSSKLDSNGGNPDMPRGRDVSDSKLVGSAGLVYSGINDLSLRAMWGQGYRFPPLNELYLGTIHGQTNRTLPNPDLKPETSDNFELGARYDDGTLNLDFALFMSMSKNFITTQQFGADSQFINSDKARTWGAELGLGYTFQDFGLTPYASAAFIKRRITNTIDAPYRTGPNASVTSRLTYETEEVGLPPFFGRVGVKFQREFEPETLFYSDLYLDWASKAKEVSYDFHDPVGAGNLADAQYGFVTNEYDGWHTFNLTLGLEWGQESKWRASLAFRNIFDKAFTRSNNAVMDPGFHIVAGLGYEF